MGRRHGLSKSELKWQQRCVSSGPEPWVFDMANGMSNRRSTLKRPIVCRSKKDGNCGMCEVEVLPSVHSAPVGSIVPTVINLTCDPLPLDQSYEVLIAGNAKLIPPVLFIPVGAGSLCDLEFPPIPGAWLIDFVFLNSQGCVVRDQIAIDTF